MTIDGRGERATTTYWLGSGTALEEMGELDYPHSLGLLYERVTEHLGFLHSSDEYKVMALASFGQPSYVNSFKDLVRLNDGGQYLVRPVDMDHEFGPRRLRGQPLEQRHYDLARSLQTVLEETVIELAQWLREASDSSNLCLAGGVALNCLRNSRLRDSGAFQNIWIQPAAGDAGTALGAALRIDSDQREMSSRQFSMNNVYLGPQFGDVQIEGLLTRAGFPYSEPASLSEVVSAHLAEDKVVGWFQGWMENRCRAG